jgi:hypothetical protein
MFVKTNFKHLSHPSTPIAQWYNQKIREVVEFKLRFVVQFHFHQYRCDDH